MPPSRGAANDPARHLVEVPAGTGLPYPESRATIVNGRSLRRGGHMHGRAISKLIALAVLAAAVLGAGTAQAAHTATSEVLKSKKDGIDIAITIFQPETATAENPVPLILHSHG